MKTKNQIQKLAKLFIAFKTHLTVFVLVNAILWIGLLLKGTVDLNSSLLYISIAWAVILLAHWLVAYEIFQTNKKDKNE